GLARMFPAGNLNELASLEGVKQLSTRALGQSLVGVVGGTASYAGSYWLSNKEWDAGALGDAALGGAVMNGLLPAATRTLHSGIQLASDTVPLGESLSRLLRQKTLVRGEIAHVRDNPFKVGDDK